MGKTTEANEFAIVCEKRPWVMVLFRFARSPGQRRSACLPIAPCFNFFLRWRAGVYLGGAKPLIFILLIAHLKIQEIFEWQAPRKS
ncbi:MAG: hypothetical protein HC848_05955 [Limnobacter sp.]|nr:hypothetical protein [Limnobacter sp.]